MDLYCCSLSSASSLLLAEFQQKVAPDQGDQEVAPQQDQGHGGAGQAAVDREAGHYIENLKADSWVEEKFM